MMNQYGQMAMKHWRRWLPSRFSMLEDPEGFFTDLGEQVAEQIVQTQLSLESQHRAELNATEDYLTRVGLLNNIRAQAQEMVLDEMVWETPEPGTDLADEALEDPGSDLTEWMDQTGMPWDRDHDLWRMSEDEAVSTQAFLTARRAWEASLREQVKNPQQGQDSPQE